jgi:hypothetical protein
MTTSFDGFAITPVVSVGASDLVSNHGETSKMSALSPSFDQRGSSTLADVRSFLQPASG